MIEFQRIDSTFPIEEILPFCEESIGDPRPGAVNMSPVDWENNTASFLYLLYKERRYDGAGNGYIICKKDDKIICGNGFSVSDIDEKMTHLNSRSYTIPGIVVPRIHGDMHTIAVDISIDEGRYGGFSSVNEYNKRFIEGFLKVNDPRNYPSYERIDGKHYGKPDFRIHPMEPAGPLNIKRTKQWILYMIWNESHRESFLETLESIRWSD